MKKYSIFLFVLIVSSIFFTKKIHGQNNSTQIFVIDSYISTEKPYKLNLSFFTSEKTTSSILISDKFEFDVSKKFNTKHKIKLDVTNFNKDNVLNVVISVKNKSGNISKSSPIKIDYPEVIAVGKESNFLLFGALFAAVFILPTPSVAFTEGDTRISITKEIPLISFTSENIKYPISYFALEYTHIYKAYRSNFFRIGYKYMKEVPVIKFVSPGIDLVTNFNGFNGIGAGVSFGLFNMLDTFTIYTRFRYNFQPSKSERNFTEISLGLYTNFFSVHF